MNSYRQLEAKFYNDIQYHIKKAFPNIYDKFYEFRFSSDYEDSNLSYDLVFSMNFTISVRIRKSNYIKYKDLTIRSKIASSNYTEIDKIKNGLAQIYFYAYMNESETELIKIRIVNVDSIRELINKEMYIHRKNNDGTEFFAFSFEDIKNHNGAIYQFDK
jgi:hypothetical protein